jgi:SAM-dependent methyltransferase
MLKRFFDSAVDWRPMDVRALTAERIGGAVDLAVFGSVLLHLRDPVGALETVYDALVPGGRVILIEPVDASRRWRGHAVARYFAAGSPWTWWYPTVECLKAWVETAGFVDLHVHDTVPVRDRTRTVQHLAMVHARRPSAPTS